MATAESPPSPSIRPRLSGEPAVALANRIAARFALPGPVEAYDFPERGNINRHTYAIEALTPEGPRSYLLQQINQQVFTKPRAVMAAMVACIEAQRANLARGRLGPDEPWEPVTLVPTREGSPFLEVHDRRGPACWRLMVRIAGAVTYKSLGAIADPKQRLFIAEQAGSGLAIFGTLSAGVDVERLGAPLPGYRDTRLYHAQLLSVLAGHRTLEQATPYLPADPEVRQSTQQHFLVHLPYDEAARRRELPEVRPFLEYLQAHADAALLLARELGTGGIRRTPIHGDTKLENFLFDARTGRVKALVDLDTIMAQTWLSDFGDMVRSLCNVAGEREADPARIQVDMDVYRAVAAGFLRSARNVTARELDLLVDSVEVIALELGMRFLTDYLRGDSYFKLGPADPPDLNKIRGLAQLTLAQRLRARGDEARACVASLRRELGVTPLEAG
jgi:Ser/Thr protein kinase RdoA (MazF antagonist)